MMKTCCFSGPIEFTATQKQLIVPILQVRIRAMLKRGITTFACTNEPGYDEAVTEVVFMLKKENPKIRLIRYLSWEGGIRGQADEIRCAGKIPSIYSADQMFKESDVCLFCPGDLYAATSIPCMEEAKLKIINILTGKAI